MRDEFLSAHEGYDNAVAAVERVKAAKAAIPLVPGVDADLVFQQGVDRVRDAAKAGETIPDDVAQQIARVDQDRDELIARRKIYGQALVQLGYDVDYVLQSRADDGLAYLVGRLDDLMPRVAAVSRNLAGASSADEAIRAGTKAVKAWSTVEALVDDYDEIRTLQFEAHDKANQLPFHTGVVARAALYRNSILHVKHFAGRRFTAAANSTPTTPAGRTWVQWLRRPPAAFDATDTDTPTPWWPTPDRGAHLLQLPHLKPWVPDLTTAANVMTAAGVATGAIQDGPSAQQVGAMQDYYNLIQVAVPTDLPAVGVNRNGNPATAQRRYDDALLLAKAEDVNAQRRKMMTAPIGGY